MKMFLQSTRPGKEKMRFEILSYNAETKQGILIGSMGVKFDADLSKEAVLKKGYKVVKGEDTDKACTE